MTMMQGLSLTGVPVSATAKRRGESWLHDCLSHVKAMHRVLACLYGGLETDAVYDVDFEDDVLSVEGDSTRLSQIFSNHCYELVKRMTSSTSGPVEFPLSQIITVINRCLCLSYADVLAVPSRTDLVTVLPHLQQCSMDVLSQLITCCGRDILHHSRIIIDLCLQTIVSTAKMPLDDKYHTRSSTYQALVLWVQSCGWGKYLFSHRKLLIQEIIADTLADPEDGLAKKNESDGSKSKHDRFGGSGRKGKKKKGQRGDSYMELETKEDAKGKEQSNAAREDLVLWAFSLSQLAVESLPFSLSQTLISHLIMTASTVQRMSPHKPHPYSQTEARKGLYQAVAGCLLSSLESSGNRNDAVSHYQFINSALDILVRACHGDHPQIQTMCSQALAVLKSSSNIKGPVIRKVLDYDDSGVEDISQLMRENEQHSDRIEDLRQKLMNSEVENEQQSRLISSLREQITTLQLKVPAVTQQQSSIKVSEQSRSVQVENDDIDDDEDEDDDTEEVSVNNDDIAKSSRADSESSRTHSQNWNKKDSHGSHTSTAFTEKEEEDSSRKSEISGKREEYKDSKVTFSKSVKRTSEEETSPKKDSKRQKLNSKGKANDGIEGMLMDFVDAPPDY